MKKKLILQCIVTFFIAQCLHAQVPFMGHLHYGSRAAGEFATSIAHSDDGQSVIVGGAPAFQIGFRQVGMKLSEPLEGLAFNSITQSRIDINHGTCVLRAVADGAGTGFNAVVGEYALPGQTQTDAMFFEFTNSGESDGTTVHWEGAGDQHLYDVLELQDHSFVVVGSSVENNVQHSIVTRLAARPSFAPIFTRQIGLPQNVNFLVDEAKAVAQLADGSLLIAGNTRHFSSSPQGSIYVMKMALDGSITAFRTYTMGSDVIQPRMSKMTILDNGTIVLVGSSRLTNLQEHKGFAMQVSANLATASYREFSQPTPSAIGLELHAAIALPGTDEYFVAGYIQQSVLNAVENNPLLMRISASAGVQIIRRVHNSSIVSEEYLDLALLHNNTILEAVGYTMQPNPGSNDTANSNVLTSRMPLDLNFCSVNAQTLTIVNKTVTTSTPLLTTSLIQPTFMGTHGFITVNLTASVFCEVSKMADAPPIAEGGMAIFPNPATSTATVHLAGLKGTAHVQICDATGRILAQRETDQVETVLDLSGFAKGILLVRISTPQQQFTQKLILQ